MRAVSVVAQLLVFLSLEVELTLNEYVIKESTPVESNIDKLMLSQCSCAAMWIPCKTSMLL